LEIFALLERLAGQPEVTLILLHVIQTHRAAGKKRAHDELSREVRSYLEQLASEYVHPIISVVPRIRVGNPAQQILEEAKAQDIQLIILPTFGPSLWNRLVSLWNPSSYRIAAPLAEKIIRESNCGVFVAGVKGRFNCQREWSKAPPKSHIARKKSKQSFIRWIAEEISAVVSRSARGQHTTRLERPD
jgi:nucleotide-binding universal stress UspA family protein